VDAISPPSTSASRSMPSKSACSMDITPACMRPSSVMLSVNRGLFEHVRCLAAAQCRQSRRAQWTSHLRVCGRHQ
jgi:hypothetical protein